MYENYRWQRQDFIWSGSLTWVAPRVGLRGSPGDAELKKWRIWRVSAETLKLEACVTDRLQQELTSSRQRSRNFRGSLWSQQIKKLQQYLVQYRRRFLDKHTLNIMNRHQHPCFSNLCRTPLLYIHCYTRSTFCPGPTLYICHACSWTGCRG